MSKHNPPITGTVVINKTNNRKRKLNNSFKDHFQQYYKNILLLLP